MYPVKEPCQITSPFGKSRTLPDGKSDIHAGVDLVNVGHHDRELVACCDAVVILDKDNYEHAQRWANKENSVGNQILFKSEKDGKTFYFAYYHVYKNHVSVGQAVKKGEVVGEYGDVGYSFGAHLHLQAWSSDWKAIDPSFLLEA